MTTVDNARGFIRRISLDSTASTGRYPFTLPVVRHLSQVDSVELAAGLTFLVGENGTGKSTVVEALAVAAGFNAEGGSQNFRFATRGSESSLGDYLRLTWGGNKPRTGYFLRAESFYNVASEIERLDQQPGTPPLLPAYGGVSLHERSHGESFLDLVTHRFGPRGLYILDEPEAALSVRGCLALMARIMELIGQGSQFVIATHSPILLAIPDARILQIDSDGEIDQVEYDEAEPVALTRGFLANPQRYLQHLVSDD
jgi:predicted ATPase